jgi:dipeptidase E
MQLELDSVHEVADPVAAVERAEAVVVGGGNTFRLLDEMYRRRLLEPIRGRAEAGMPYLGWSAGANVACPSLMTTNDMPIVQPPGFQALSLVPFNINPHYLDPDPASRHMGETREQRIQEFHEMNDAVVVGLREGAMIRVEDPQATLRGSSGARIFRKKQLAMELEPGASLDFLLRPS